MTGGDGRGGAGPPARDDVQRLVLDNGLTLLVRRDTTAPVVAIVTWVKAGYFDEADDVVGISHVLEHMYFKGTPTRGPGEIAKATKAGGGILNAGTIYDHTAYYTVLPAARLAAGLDIQFDAYAHSVIDAGELARELEVIIQEARRKADDPGAVTIETLYEVLHDRHRMRRWRIGREPLLRSFTRDTVDAFYRAHYRPSNTVLAVVGDVDPGEVVAGVAARWGTLPAGAVARDRGPREEGPAGFRWRELEGDIVQGHAAIGWRTTPLDHPDTPRLDLAAAVLGSGRASRLYRAVRDRQLASDVGAFHYTPTELGVFALHVEGPAATLAAATRAAWAEVHALAADGVLERDLVRARRLHEARWLRRLESMDGQAMHLAEWEASGDWRAGDRYLAALLTATPADVTGAIRRHLDAAQASAVAYRPRGQPPLVGAGEDPRRWLDAARPARPPLADVADLPAVVAPPRAPALVEERGPTTVHRTAHGVPVIVRRRPGSPMVHLAVTALGGAVDDPVAVAGRTALALRSSVRGTTVRGAAALARATEELGGSLGPNVTSDSFGWSISVPLARLPEATALLAEVVLEPAFAPEAIEAERAKLMSDLASLRDDMYAWPMRLMLDAAYAGHPYGTSVLGTPASLAALDVGALRDWHGALRRGAPLVLALAGDVDPAEAAALLAGAFAPLEHAEPPVHPVAPWPSRAITSAESRAKQQTAICIAYPGPARRDADRFAAHLLSGIASGLGGRFFEELRDRRSLAYTVVASPRERPLGGLFSAYIATSPEREGEAREGLVAEFARLRAEPVTHAELARAREHAIGAHAIRQQGGAAVLGDVLDAWLFGEGLVELEAWEGRVRAVTPADIQALAQRDFDDARRVEGVVRGTAPSS
ncbi:MAG: insulinase family protein [Gemmatimonadetes bacterium]|nr:insulinase family protein [Gemmatimonadota bacterium]